MHPTLGRSVAGTPTLDKAFPLRPAGRISVQWPIHRYRATSPAAGQSLDAARAQRLAGVALVIGRPGLGHTPLPRFAALFVDRPLWPCGLSRNHRPRTHCAQAHPLAQPGSARTQSHHWAPARVAVCAARRATDSCRSHGTGSGLFRAGRAWPRSRRQECPHRCTARPGGGSTGYRY
ncbi:hypothetical protein D9M71_593240 [compost metagenome]